MRLLLIATIMTVLAHLTGSILKDYESIKTTLKSEMIILLEDFPQKKKLKEILISLSEQIVKTSREQLTKFDKEKLIVENEEKIKESIRSIGDQHVIEHPVFKLLFQRYVNFVHQLIDQPTNVAIPNGLNLVMNETMTTLAFFLRLITYNKMVFNEHYDRILMAIRSN